jgi:hypothetical protein
MIPNPKSSKNLLKLSRVFDNENVICLKNVMRQENSFSGEKNLESYY